MFSNHMNLKHPEHRHNSHRAHPVASTGRSAISKRRSNRMLLHAPIGLSGEDRHKCSFTLTAKAVHLNKHGAAIQLNRELKVGSVVQVKNQRGAEASARVVAQLAALQGVLTYGIEFVEQGEAGDFWGISFPSNA